MRIFQPDFIFSGGSLRAGAALCVRDGRVESVGSVPADAHAEVVPLHRCAVLPGLVTAHSHAFQRAIRGRTEHRAHARDDFWSWREEIGRASCRERV